MTKNIKYALTSLLGIFSFTLLAQEKLIFEENFDVTELNTEIWNYEEGDGCPNLCGWGNNERQIYNRDYVAVEDGKLVITAVKDGEKYFSGRITTKDKLEFQFGEIEFRAKLATGQGIWPAVWMLGADINEVSWPASGEIDMLEYVGKEPGMLYTSLHTPKRHADNANTQKTKIEGIEDGFHVYKVDWNKDFIEFFVDGTSVYKFEPESYDSETYPFRKKFYLLVNMAIGGNFGGPEVDDAIFPQKFYVDYIRVKQHAE
ncbi:MAG: glycoside hydrolase family 16 protein [Christiangramia sp.]|nr:laminarinase [Christiangramia sp.]|tara:strand:+ start:872 stop:1648 length:777 start_codon:yes stop_codon:yes gene_type:complete